MPRSRSVPRYGLHKATGQARVILSGKHFYLGPHGTDASRERYLQVLAHWRMGTLPEAHDLANSTAPSLIGEGMTVAELILRYWQHCETYYRTPAGEPSSEVSALRQTMRRLRRVHGSTRAMEFGPLALKATRQSMIDHGMTRKSINREVDRIRRMFRWAVENELLPPAVHEALRAVRGLSAGRSEAIESEPVVPVPFEHVDAVLPHLTPTVRAMVEVQRWSGCRPGEVIRMRSIDIDTSGAVWLYRPPNHKTAHRGHDREIYLNARAQTALGSFLDAAADPSSYLFSPRAGRQAYFAALRAKSKSRGNAKRKRKAKPRRAPRDCYTVPSYARAIAKACIKASVPHWSPHQLRHARGTEIRSEHGLDVAQLLLGHKRAAITEVYAEANRAKVLQVLTATG